MIGSSVEQAQFKNFKTWSCSTGTIANFVAASEDTSNEALPFDSTLESATAIFGRQFKLQNMYSRAA